MNWQTMYCRGFEDGLIEKEYISRIQAYKLLPEAWHEFVDCYLDGRDDGVMREWTRYNALNGAAHK